MSEIRITPAIEQIISRLNNKQKEKKYIPKYMKPKLIHDVNGQYPHRCPICWDKYFFKNQAQECLDRCWEELPPKIWAYIESTSKEPQELSSWQWDLDKEHKKWCGIVLYNNGETRCYKSTDQVATVSMISEKELIALLDGEAYIYQQGKFELPHNLKKYGELQHIKYIMAGNRHSSFKRNCGIDDGEQTIRSQVYGMG